MFHRIETVSTGAGHFEAPDTRLVVEGAENGIVGYGIGGWTSEGVGRIDYGGPMVAGPYAFAFGLCGVISAAPRRERRPNVVSVAPGDTLEIDGERYVVGLDRGRYPTLIPKRALATTMAEAR